MNWRAAMPQTARPTAPASTAYRARRRYDTPATKYPDDVALGLHMPDLRAAIMLPADESRTKIAVLGDSLAEALAFGMDADQAFKIDFLVRQRTVSASGLVRDDFHDWPKAITALTSEHRDLAAVIIMLGLNDRQVLRVGTENLEPLSDAWREAYKKRIDAVISAAANSKAPVFWVGFPVMRLPKLSADLMAMNEIIRERVVLSGNIYVETADIFSDSSGAFTITGPDVIGDIVRLRGPDGIHFTPAGQRKLAFFVERSLRKLLRERSPPPLSAPAPLPASTSPGMPESAASAIPTPEISSVLVPEIPLTIPAPTGEFSIAIALPDGLLIAFPRQRAAIGEARALTETRSATQLIGREKQTLPDVSARDLFDRGLPPEPRTGRSDDFIWR